MNLAGMLTLEVTSADPEGLLSALEQVDLQDVRRVGYFELGLCIHRRDLRRVKQILEKRGEAYQLRGRNGLYWTFKRLFCRPVLVVGLTLLLMLSVWVPGRVFFFRVEGNCNVPTAKILEQAEICGLRFGASRRQLRSEFIKNELLNAMPQLQWAGVNTYGCVAVISVRERIDPAPVADSHRVTSLVALRDGIIRQVTVMHGTAQCKPGDAVKAGQILVSGYTDCGIYIQAGKAQGEIYAQTRRNLTAFFPTVYQARGNITTLKREYSLLIGKKLINFAKGSGISGGSCAKIKSVYYMTLPGGLQLPVALVVEKTICYDTAPEVHSEAASRLEQFASFYLRQQMVAGSIEGASHILTDLENLCRLDGSYICTEMIGVQRIEENLIDYGKNH